MNQYMILKLVHDQVPQVLYLFFPVLYELKNLFLEQTICQGCSEDKYFLMWAQVVLVEVELMSKNEETCSPIQQHVVDAAALPNVVSSGISNSV